MTAAADRQPELRLISWPFHNGLRNVSMGRGATRLAADIPLRGGIEQEGWTVTVEEIDPVDESAPEIVRVIELIRRLASHVNRAVADYICPLVLAGNCNSALGTTAGIGAENLGVVWFDAHADFDDPEENESGFFDVMGLAMLTAGLARAPRNHPRPRAGAGRKCDPRGSAGPRGLPAAPPTERRPDQRPASSRSGRLNHATAVLATRVSRVYLHVDLDSLDAAEARANQYAAPGGPSLARLLDCIRLTCERFDDCRRRDHRL